MKEGDMPLDSENSRYLSRFNENANFRNLNDTHHASVVTQREQPNATHSPPNTDSEWIGQMPAVLDEHLL